MDSFQKSQIFGDSKRVVAENFLEILVNEVASTPSYNLDALASKSYFRKLFQEQGVQLSTSESR